MKSCLRTRKFFRIFGVFVLLTASALSAVSCKSTDQAPSQAGNGMGSGMGSGMMARHSADVPDEYEGLQSLLSADQTSFTQGEEIYTTNCATCHGDGGMGDGPTGTALDPAPAPVAHTSQMLGDDYLYWRISEGGAFAPFNSSMPAWKDVLSEQESWQVIAYMRALGDGQVTPKQNMGGEMFSAEEEMAQREAMLQRAIDSGVITEEEKELFNIVHNAIEEYAKNSSSSPLSGGMVAIENDLLEKIKDEGLITPKQAEDFLDIRNRLVEAGIME